MDEDAAPVRWEKGDTKSNANKPRTFTASGFSLCTMFNKAQFYSNVFVEPLDGSFNDNCFTIKEFVELVDESAELIVNKLHREKREVDISEVHRYACYMAATGSNAMAPLAEKRLLARISAPSYFSFLPTLVDNLKRNHQRMRTSEIRNIYGATPTREKYAIAYLLLVHDSSCVRCIKDLVDEIDDGNALVLIHVDLRSDYMYHQLQYWLTRRKREAPTPRTMKDYMKAKRRSEGSFWSNWGGSFQVDDSDESDFERTSQADKKHTNVFLANFRHKGFWGHKSLVWMQLSGYFELMGLADWDFTINLSGQDYPLRSSSEIHRWLMKDGNRGKGYGGMAFIEKEEMREKTDVEEIARRIYTPWLTAKNGDYMARVVELGVIPPPFPHWSYIKHSQWMILSRRSVESIGGDWQSLEAFAWGEFTTIPDEMLIGTVLYNNPSTKNNTLLHNKRYIDFPPQVLHPLSLDIRWKDRLPVTHEEPPYFHLRKVNGGTRKGQEFLAWIRENHIDLHG
ncbi:hypothetical protein HDV05_008478 [Chytridiales sp. JEL 0842]|nr:hypothetical protein HDV05_008478 [Chytridiales sp. JEL 0842]